MSERAWRLFFLSANTWQNCALSSSLGMAPTLFTSVLVSVLHCTVIDLYGKSVFILQPQTMVSAAAQCPALWMALANTSALQGELLPPYPVCAWSTQTHRSAALQSQEEKHPSTQRSLEFCSQTCWHSKIWFNLTSPQCTMNIIWLIWYNDLCCCSWSDLCCHYMSSWKVSLGLDVT